MPNYINQLEFQIILINQNLVNEPNVKNVLNYKYLNQTKMAKEKTVEQVYQKKTQLEHILLRPDTYIGTVQPIKQQKWVLPKGEMKLQYKQILYTPGFYKIFDQVLVNAADNYQRDRKMSSLKVSIDQSSGSISVFNNGKGIPIVIHKQHKIYIPEMIFGHLLTGSNYNDDQKRIVGGRNGYGAKLANVFSNKFIVECGDSETHKRFKMTWKKNMSMHDQPTITSYQGKDFVQVTFFPCFEKFNMEHGLDDDTVSLMCKRVYDMAGIMPRVKVSLNQKIIDIKSFSDYVDLYFDGQASPIKIFDRQINTDRWEVIVSISEGQFRQVSFVNSVCTTKGGTHVNYLVDQVVQKIQEKIKRKQKNLNIKPFQIKAHIWIFVNCLIENPTFDTQTKQTMTLKASQFGSKCELSQKMIKQFLKLGIVQTVINLAKSKQMQKLSKATAGTKKSKLTGIPKLQDANEAGTRNSQKCTLILTQGDSAKALAMSGLSVIGRDYYGVFPLRGKLLNVRQAANKQLLANEEVQNMLKILGLAIGRQYQDLKSLRYGAVMIMSDQDTDGSHIKGLVINFIHFFWPSLFKINGFLKQFITPLLKVSKGTQVTPFYTMNDFKVWAQSVGDTKSWKIKYYKGLGTSDDKQAKQYFENIRKHKIDFRYVDVQDDNSIELIFNKKRAQDRKQWLTGYDPNQVMVYDRPSIRYKQFVDREFIHFSNQDNYRSIASLVDGFKPGQRKIIYGCFKRNLVKEMKVAQLGGYIAEHSAYHHGEMSLVETIVGMAQNYVGSNNINLLVPNGQFGSRNSGGKDHASARYIFTELSKVTRCIFPQPDDHSLTYVEDDGQMVQPLHYIPIIPMILVNGCQGIGTGWSTYIPNFNPRELAQLIKHRLRTGQQFREIHPWYKNYNGNIEMNSERSYDTYGIIQIDENKENTVVISELQVQKWTKDFKLAIDQIMKQGQQKLVGLREYHTNNTVHFQIQMNQSYFNQLYLQDDMSKFIKYFKLAGSISMKNMVGFNREGKIKKMANVKQIMDQFYEIRMEFYQKRKQYLRSRLVRDLVLLQQKQRFIIQVVQEKIVIRNVKRIQLCKVLKDRKYRKFSEIPQVKTTKHVPQQKKKLGEGQGQAQNQDSATQANQVENARKPQDQSKQYNYLLEMPLWNLTYEKVQQIKKKRQVKQDQLAVLQKFTIKDMWIQDLDKFLEVLEKVEQKQVIEREKEDLKMKKNHGKGKVQKAAKKRQVKPKKTKQYDWDNQNSQTQAALDKKSKVKKQQKKQLAKPNKQKAKKQGSKAPKAAQNDDFMSRLHRRMQSAPDNLITTKQIQSKQTTLDSMLKKPSETKFQFQMVPNPNKKPQASKRKKMKLDSDEESEEEVKYDDNTDGDDSYSQYQA